MNQENSASSCVSSHPLPAKTGRGRGGSIGHPEAVPLLQRETCSHRFKLELNSNWIPVFGDLQLKIERKNLSFFTCKMEGSQDLPGGPVVTALLPKTGAAGSTPGWEAKIPCASWPKPQNTNRSNIVTKLRRTYKKWRGSEKIVFKVLSQVNILSIVKTQWWPPSPEKVHVLKDNGTKVVIMYSLENKKWEIA